MQEKFVIQYLSLTFSAASAGQNLRTRRPALSARGGSIAGTTTSGIVSISTSAHQHQHQHMYILHALHCPPPHWHSWPASPRSYLPPSPSQQRYRRVDRRIMVNNGGAELWPQSAQLDPGEVTAGKLPHQTLHQTVHQTQNRTPNSTPNTSPDSTPNQ